MTENNNENVNEVPDINNDEAFKEVSLIHKNLNITFNALFGLIYRLEKRVEELEKEGENNG